MYEGRIVHETAPAATDERTLGLVHDRPHAGSRA